LESYKPLTNENKFVHQHILKNEQEGNVNRNKQQMQFKEQRRNEMNFEMAKKRSSIK
jgi:hypothetical protein